MNSATPPHVVIVGGGFGGLNAARALRRAPVQITLLDRRNHHLFQPLLYQVASAALSAVDIAYPIRAILRRQSNARVLLAEVEALDLARREVILSDVRVSYDFLILAAGNRYSYFGHRQWARHAPGLKSLEDALEIRRRILLAFEHAEREADPARRLELLTFVIIGGGPTGVEMAGAIAEIARFTVARDFRTIDPRQARVILIEAGPSILPTFPVQLSAKAERVLRKLGVEVMTNCPVTTIDEEAVTAGKARVATRTALWAAGMEASPIAKSLGTPLDRGGRAIVRPDLTIPGHREVFVIGDLASFAGPDGEPLAGVAPVAIQQGRHAARNIIRACAGQPLKEFYYNDRGTLAAIGRSQAIANFRRIKASGFIAWLLWLFVHIIELVGFRNRVIVLFEWAWAYFTNQRGARLITGDLERAPAPRDAEKDERGGPAAASGR